MYKMVPIFLALAKRLISQARAMDLKIHTKRSLRMAASNIYTWTRTLNFYLNLIGYRLKLTQLDFKFPRIFIGYSTAWIFDWFLEQKPNSCCCVQAYSSSEKQLQIFCPLDPFCHNIGEEMDIKNTPFKFCDNYTAKSNKNQPTSHSQQ